MRMECGKCGGFWVSPDNAQKLMDERDEARAERDKAQRIAIKSRGIIVGLEKNVTTAAVKLVEFWEAQGGGNGVMARALEDALIREVTAYKKTPAFTDSSQNAEPSHGPSSGG